MTVAVIDSGVSANLPDLAGQVSAGTVIGGNGSGTNDSSDNGHGTTMAALIAGTGRGYNGAGIQGLAPAAKVMPIQVPMDGTSQDIAAGIDYAVAHGARVINISLAGFSGSPAEEEAINRAINQNVVVVAGSGDAATTLPEYPAAYAGVVSVGAVDSTGAVASFSASGPSLTVTAPGVDVPWLYPNGNHGSGYGTSQATAYTSATIALLRSKYPSYTVGQIEDLLAHTADRKTASPHDDRYGYGIIDPYAALTTTYVPPASVAPLGTDTDSAAPTSYYTPGQVVPGPPIGTEEPSGPVSPSRAASPAAAAGQSGGSSGMGMVFGVVGGVVVVAGAATAWAVWRRKRTVVAVGGLPPEHSGPPFGPPGGPEQPPAPPPGFVGGPPRW